MDIQTQLAQGIQAAKNGDRATAGDIFYAVLDQEPKHEAAWIWLSYVVNSVEDRQVCLENVLTINPDNQYARRGLTQIKQLPVKRAPATSRPMPLVWAVAFWAGMGAFLLLMGLLDIFNWGFDLLKSRNFPNYITPSQLWSLTIAIGFLVAGILVVNVAWALFAGHKAGYFAAIILSLILILAAPMALLIAPNPNYILTVFAAAVPTIILFLTLMSQAGFEHGQKLAPYSK